MTADLTQDDSGKTVVRETERIGVVTDVRSGEAVVDPDWDRVSEDLAEALDWDPGAEACRLDESAVTAVQNAEVRLRDDLA